MAVLAATKLFSLNLTDTEGLSAAGAETPGVTTVGRRIECWQITGTLAASSATEWLATGLTSIEAVFGEPSLVGDVQLASSEWSLQLNARGTGVAAGTNAGDLGVSLAAGTAIDVFVTVVGTQLDPS